MSEWVSKPLGEIVTIQKGRKVNTSSYPVDGYREYLGAGKLAGSSDGYASTFLAVEADEKDVLMLWDGERSGLCRTGLSGVVSSTVSKLTPVGPIDSSLLYYLLLRRFGWIQHRRTGTGVPHVPKDLGRILTLSYPRREDEQKKIARILQTIDQAIEKTEALIEKYQQIKAGLIHDLFARGIRPDGQLRPPREQAPELYQETPIGHFPKEWAIRKIGDVFSIQLGKMLNRASKMGRNELPYLGNKDVQWDRVVVNELETMNFSHAEREKFKLCYGDLLVCEGGEVGRTAMWRQELDVCFYQKAIHRLRPHVGDVLSAFMLRFMFYAKTTGMFGNFTSQTSIAHLTREKLASVTMVVPPLPEQERFVAQFDGIDKKLDDERLSIQKLQKQKAGLMHDLLTGKVPVQVEPEAESEAVYV